MSRSSDRPATQSRNSPPLEIGKILGGKLMIVRRSLTAAALVLGLAGATFAGAAQAEAPAAVTAAAPAAKIKQGALRGATVEGVETFEQLKILALQVKPDLVQGFLFGAALSASGIETMSNVTWPFAAEPRLTGKRTARLVP